MMKKVLIAGAGLGGLATGLPEKAMK